MIALLAAAAALSIAALVEIVVPGHAIYHLGWYNVALAAVTIFSVSAARRALREATSIVPRVAASALLCSALIAGVAVVASGLLAPGNRTIVSAPGESVAVAELGASLHFPALETKGPRREVTVGRGKAIGGRNVDLGSFVARTFMRHVVAIEVRDLRGGSLTITQPTGSSFLSPVLLMRAHQRIDGLDLPYDAFSVPSARRTVKAVLFSSSQAALMRGMSPLNRGAVLFAVSDDRDRPVANAIGLLPSGVVGTLGNLQLRGTIVQYPAVVLMAAPSLVAVGLAVGMLLVGGVLTVSQAKVLRSRLRKPPLG